MSKKIVIAVIIIAVIIVSVIALLVYFDRPAPIQKLTDNDFKISDWRYDSYVYEYINRNWVANPSKSINWTAACDGCKQYGADDCTASSWHLSIYASQDLSCQAAIDGVGTEDLNKLTGETGGQSYITSGASDVSFLVGKTGAIVSNLDLTKSHEIKVCCTTRERTPDKYGVICKSATIQPKCEAANE